MSLVVKRFKELISLVDQLLDALARGIRGLPGNEGAYDGERKGRGQTGNANPHQRARQISVALVRLRLRADLVNFLCLRRVRQSLHLPLEQAHPRRLTAFARERVFSSRIARA